MDRPQLLEMAHRNSVPGMDIGQFAMIFGEWDFYPIYAKQQVIGTVMVLQNEIHMALDTQFQRRTTNWRDGLRCMIQPLLEKYGCVVTVVQNTDEKSKRFVERIGFVPERHGEIVTLYKLAEIKIKKRGARCQQ